LSLRASSLAGARWCSVTTKAGELPTQANGHAGRPADGHEIMCVESSVEIDAPALLEADVVRIHVQQKRGERPRVASVRGIRR
jgi:hypothetical protein